MLSGTAASSSAHTWAYESDRVPVVRSRARCRTLRKGGDATCTSGHAVRASVAQASAQAHQLAASATPSTASRTRNRTAPTCDECLGPRDRRFSHTDRARGPRGGVRPLSAPSRSRRVRESRRRVDGSTAVRRVTCPPSVVSRYRRAPQRAARPSHPPSAADGSAQGTSPPGRP